MDPAKGFKASTMERDAFTTAIGRLFGFAYVWAIGGNLAPTSTEAFDEFVQEHLQDVVSFPGTSLCHAVHLLYDTLPTQFRRCLHHVCHAHGSTWPVISDHAVQVGNTFHTL